MLECCKITNADDVDEVINWSYANNTTVVGTLARIDAIDDLVKRERKVIVGGDRGGSESSCDGAGSYCFPSDFSSSWFALGTNIANGR